MIGEKKFSLKKSEKVNLNQRRSIFSIKDIDIGEKLTSLNISSFRPFIGINSNSIKHWIVCTNTKSEHRKINNQLVR